MSHDSKAKGTVTKFLYDWKLKLAIASAIIVPTTVATGNFFKMEMRLNEKNQLTENRISKLELDSERNFADKPSMVKLQTDVTQLRVDTAEIKALLKRKLQ